MAFYIKHNNIEKYNTSEEFSILPFNHFNDFYILSERRYG